MTNTIIEILIDYSGSMGFMKGTDQENKTLINGRTRMSIVKKALINEVIPTLDYCSHINIRRFSTTVSVKNNHVTVLGKKIKLLYGGEFDLHQITKEVSNLQDPPLGGTPISSALNQAYDALKKKPDWDRKVILVTDGEENSGGNFSEAAKKIIELPGTKCNIFVVGFALTKEASERIKKVATGGFFNLKDNQLKDQNIKQSLNAIKKSVLSDTLNKGIDINKEDIKNKIISLDKESKNSRIEKVNSIEKKIRDYISIGNDLLSEFSEIKESLSQIEETQILSNNSTTISIDPDYSEKLGLESEKFLFEHLKTKHGNKVVWVNQKTESHLPFDFKIQDEEGNTIQYIECKGTPSIKPTFYLSKKEWSFFLKEKHNYQLYRVYNLESSPKILHFENLFESLLNEEVVPYLNQIETLKENRVFLTITNK
tara:strand:- start:3751 stop:5031 length:1281 start_codon:yes stop_codon:yes gene_type:complete